MQPADDRPLYNSIIIRSYIRLINKKYSHINLDELLSYSGMDMYQVEDDGHWFTQEQVNLFYDRLVQLTGEKDIAREAGRFSASPDNVGLMRSYLLGLMGLARVYDLMGKWTTKFTRSSVYAPKKIAPNKVEITVTPNEGVKEEPFQCANRLGYVEGFSRLFNAKPPHVEHPECLFHGDDVCRYIISWQEPASTRWRQVRNVATLILVPVFLVSLFLAFFDRTLLIIPPIALAIGLFLFWTAERSGVSELKDALDEVSASSEKQMEQIEINYDNSLLINEVGQAFGKETDIDGVLEQISDIFSKRLDYDRGLFMLANRSKTRLDFRTGYGYTDEQLSKLGEMTFRTDDPQSGGVFSASFRGKKPAVFNDLQKDSDDLSDGDHKYIQTMGPRSMICCPIVYEDEPLGILAVENVENRRPFRQSDINLLMGVASQIASRIHNISLEDRLRQTQKLEAVGNLAGGVAHDFNNILTTILGYSELIISSLPEDDPRQEDIHIIYHSGERAAALTRQLLAISRKQEMEMKVNNLNTIVNDLGKMLGRLIEEDIFMELYTEKPVGNMMADVSGIEQIIMNLVINARDAMPCGGRLVIETGEAYLDEKYAEGHSGAKAGSYAVLSVTDTGAGMTEDVRERIFEPFYTTKEVGKGTGLGLSTVYGIVKEHKGFINVYSEPEKGTTFKVFFPQVREEVAEKSLMETKTMAGGTETLLIVDDDSSIRKLVVDTLEPLGYKIMDASCGEEAVHLSRATKGEIDLVLSDVIMPGMNGRQLIHILRQERPEIKAILMSGYPNHAADRDSDLEPDVVFINKPFPPIALTDTIRKLLDETPVD